MALACLACHAMDNSTDSFRMDNSFRMQNLSVHSDNGRDGCGGVSACFAKKPAPTRQRTLGEPTRELASPKAPQRGLSGLTSFGRPAEVSLDHMVFPEPRLTRCHAVRRDLFSNWTVGEVETEAGGRQLCFNLSGTA